MKTCENCGIEHDGTYGSGRFCSVNCSRGFSTKAKRKEISEKVSKTIQARPKNIREIYCKSCGEKLEKNSRKKYCIECKNFVKSRELFKKLNIYDTNIKIAVNKSLKILKNEYFINKLSLPDIQNKYNIQLNTVHFFFRKNGIKLRTNQESIHLCYINGKLRPQTGDIYKHGIHICWNTNKVYLRSSYEFDYAQELDDYKILYEVESKRIEYYDSVKNIQRIAIPDFYLPMSNMIVEIKSSYTLDLQNMKDKFKTYKELGYNTKLIVDKKELKII